MGTKRYYPEQPRRIRYKDPDSGKNLVFLTNRAGLNALTAYGLYKSTQTVELFLKFVKGNLRDKRFLGTSINAVKSQLWIAVSVYVVVAILRKRLGIDTPLHTMLQNLPIMPFEQVHLVRGTYDGGTECRARSQSGPATPVRMVIPASIHASSPAERRS